MNKHERSSVSKKLSFAFFGVLAVVVFLGGCSFLSPQGNTTSAEDRLSSSASATNRIERSRVEQILPPLPSASATEKSIRSNQHGLAVAGIDTNTIRVSLAWEASVSPQVVGYRVYWGPSSRQYTNSVRADSTEITIRVPKNITNYFAVVAYDELGTESEFSNEIAWLAVPTPPTNYVTFWVTERTNIAEPGRIIWVQRFTNAPNQQLFYQSHFSNSSPAPTVLRFESNGLWISNTNPIPDED